MRAIYVDDERSAHVNFYYDLKDRTEFDFVKFFFTASEALEYVRENPIECAFLDIDLDEEMNGIELCKEIKKIQPNVETVFVTAHNNFALDSYHVGGCAYLSKPYAERELDKAIKILQKLTFVHSNEGEESVNPKDVVFMKTFGNFDLIVNQVSVNFKTSKAKELLAFLIQQRGGTVNSAQVFMALWEKQEYTSSSSTYVRRTVRALKEQLEQLGLEDILMSNRNCYSVDIQQFTCDFYKLMDGDREVAEQYNGEYMSQYAWGEMIIPMIERKIESITC